jgi:hypothetical protein
MQIRKVVDTINVGKQRARAKKQRWEAQEGNAATVIEGNSTNIKKFLNKFG